jgi:hypothetical protein
MQKKLIDGEDTLTNEAINLRHEPRPEQDFLPHMTLSWQKRSLGPSLLLESSRCAKHRVVIVSFFSASFVPLGGLEQNKTLLIQGFVTRRLKDLTANGKMLGHFENFVMSDEITIFGKVQ